MGGISRESTFLYSGGCIRKYILNSGVSQGVLLYIEGVSHDALLKFRGGGISWGTFFLIQGHFRRYFLIGGGISRGIFLIKGASPQNVPFLIKGVSQEVLF